MVEDYENSVVKQEQPEYHQIVQNDIKFQVYTGIGSYGALPDLIISTEILNEKRRWDRNIRLNVFFEEDIIKVLHSGLVTLSSFFDQVLQDYDLELPELEQDKESIEHLIQYYKDNGHLSSPSAGRKNLSFLKAAAVCEIINIEKKKNDVVLQRVKKAYDKRIYEIAAELRRDIFLNVELPECIFEFARVSENYQQVQKLSLLAENETTLERDFISSKKQQLRDVFICHASEDKLSIVEPLVEQLNKAGISYWYDEREIMWGDSLIDKINEGLKVSKYVMVVLSISFIQKSWPNKELEAALNIEFSNGKTKVLPLIAGTKDEEERILVEYPILSSKLYLSWYLGLEFVMKKLKERIKN